jgi:hypothetical protein
VRREEVIADERGELVQQVRREPVKRVAAGLPTVDRC